MIPLPTLFSYHRRKIQLDRARETTSETALLPYNPPPLFLSFPYLQIELEDRARETASAGLARRLKEAEARAEAMADTVRSCTWDA